MAHGSTIGLSLSGVTKAYGKVRALDDLSLDVPEGRFFVLFGPSAVGKTTTEDLLDSIFSQFCIGK